MQMKISVWQFWDIHHERWLNHNRRGTVIFHHLTVLSPAVGGFFFSNFACYHDQEHCLHHCPHNNHHVCPGCGKWSDLLHGRVINLPLLLHKHPHEQHQDDQHQDDQHQDDQHHDDQHQDDQHADRRLRVKWPIARQVNSTFPAKILHAHPPQPLHLHHYPRYHWQPSSIRLAELLAPQRRGAYGNLNPIPSS